MKKKFKILLILLNCVTSIQLFAYQDYSINSSDCALATLAQNLINCAVSLGGQPTENYAESCSEVIYTNYTSVVLDLLWGNDRIVCKHNSSAMCMRACLVYQKSNAFNQCSVACDWQS